MCGLEARVAGRQEPGDSGKDLSGDVGAANARTQGTSQRKLRWHLVASASALNKSRKTGHRVRNRIQKPAPHSAKAGHLQEGQPDVLSVSDSNVSQGGKRNSDSEEY